MTKRIFITTILCSLLHLCKASPIDLNLIRETFFNASYDQNAYFNLKKTLSKEEIKDSTLQKAYNTALKILTAKYETKFWLKIEEIKTNSNVMNQIINQSPDNLELHFLRFSLEWHIPFYVFISRHTTQDKDFIVNHIKTSKSLNLSLPFKELLFNFLNQTNEFDQDELNIIHKNLFYTTKP